MRKLAAIIMAWMLTRVHKYNHGTWLVQAWDYDNCDPACVLGKVWNTVHCDDKIAQRLGIHPRMHAIFDTKAEAKAFCREYRKQLVAAELWAR